MALQSGTKLGPYEVVSPLGAGGMGEVYRARDTKLNRDVALKVLPETLSHDSERMARFKREAQVLASLNHPNIATIHGFEESGSLRALVMELVEGQTLAERIAVGEGSALPRERGALPYDEALPIARQIADALEYAHEKGVIHRDLKPANVKITPEGQVKVLDFGLAKALEVETSISSNISNSPTLTAPATQAGVILGTAAYMSPEQARGKAADRRADIWSFGCLLYEMLTGRKPFEGDTVSDTLAAVLRAEPEWEALPADTPAAIRRLLRRCLTKDTKQRLQAVGEARIAIEEAISGVRTEESSARVGAETPPLQPRQHVLPWAITAVVLIGLAALAGWWVRGRGMTQPERWTAEMLGGPQSAMGPRISPDGHTLAFQAFVDGLTQVAVMDTQSGDWTVLTKNRTRGFVTELSWSPDGSEIYFDREYSVPQGVYAVSRFGGDERLVLKDAKGPEVLPDGSLLVVRVNQDRNFQVYHLWPENGRVVALDAFPYGSNDLCPPVRAFRDGKDAVFFGRTREQDAADVAPHLYAINLASGKTRRLARQIEISPPASLPNFPMGIWTNDESVLVNQLAGNLNRIISIPRDGAGRVRTLFTLSLEPLFIDVGKNGDLYVDQLQRPYEILRFSASGGIPESLTGSESTLSDERYPFLLPDGRAVLGAMVAGRLKLLAATAGGEQVPLVQTKEDASFPSCMVGKEQVAFLLGPTGHSVVALASVADGQIVRRLTDISPGEIADLAASPDGKTLYYATSGTVWSVPVSGGQPSQVADGESVAADPNGKYLIVQTRSREGIRLMRVPVSGGKGTPIPIQTDMRLAPIMLSPDAVGNDGKVLVTLASPDSWFYEAGVLDLRTGKITRIALNYTGDVFSPGWLADGRVISAGLPTKVTLWRFRPETSKE
jgi:eukaryotic-like serine/threonine-protein kinase